MKINSRRTRLACYKRALEQYIQYPDREVGLCGTFGSFMGYHVFLLSKEFKELAPYKPKLFYNFPVSLYGEMPEERSEALGYWWDNNEDRISVLIEVIAKMQDTWYKRLLNLI